MDKGLIGFCLLFSFSACSTVPLLQEKRELKYVEKTLLKQNDAYNLALVNGSVSGDSAVGGIAGEKERNATFSENRVTAQITGTSEFGLIVGRDNP